MGVKADAEEFVDFVEDGGTLFGSERSGHIEDFAFAFFGDFVFSVFELVVGLEAFATGALGELADDVAGEVKEGFGFVFVDEG